MADKKVYINNGTAVVQVGAGNLTGLADVTITTPSSGQSLSWNGTAWVNSNAGAGDVVGAASSTDNAITRFDGTTGKVIQNSVATIDDVGNASGFNSINFNLTPSTPPTTAGSLYWDSADGSQTLSLVMAGGTATQQIGEEQYFRIKASSAITNGQVVMFTGTVGASGALTGAPATGLTATTASYVMGIATQDIALNGWGYVTSFGLVRNINTSAFTAGDILYFNSSVAGGLTTTIPTAPNAKVQVCAVIYSSATVGSLFVRPSFGGILGQFEGDVNFTSTVAGNLIRRNAGNTAWENVATIPNTNLANSSITINGGAISLGGTVSVGTVTSVSGTAPISVATGTTTPAITIAQATTSTSGYLSSTDWNTFNGKQAAGSYVTVGGALGTPSSGTLTNCTFPTLNQNTTGSSGSCTGNSATATTASGVSAGVVAGKMVYDTFTATAAQTTFTNSVTYTSGKIEVYVNGCKMRNGTDVTVTSGTSVVFASGLAVGSLVDLVYPI
jgi:hypothetical protein